MTASSRISGFSASEATDGQQSTYWESTDAVPQTLTVDLGSVSAVGRLVLELPDNPDWGTRTQTISVRVSTDGRKFRQVSPPMDYLFDATASSHDAVVLTLPNAAAGRYVQLRFTTSSNQPHAQIAEFGVYSS